MVSSRPRARSDSGDEEIGDKPPAYRAGLGLGRTFQSATLFPELTVTETLLVALEGKSETGVLSTALALPRATRRSRRDRAAVGDLVELLGLGGYRDHYIADLSTGTRRVVELAGLLALDAKVLCLDEPTAGLAQRETEAFGPLIVTVQRQLDASVLLIEHDMPLIMGISDRVYCLEAGTGHLRGPAGRRARQSPGDRQLPRYRRARHQPERWPAPGCPRFAARGAGRDHRRRDPHDRRHRDGRGPGHGRRLRGAGRRHGRRPPARRPGRGVARRAGGQLAAAKTRAEVEPFVLDVKDAAGIARLVARAAELGPLRAVAHAAGVSPTMADWREILTINLIGTALLVDACLPLASHGDGRRLLRRPWRRCSRSGPDDVPADAVLDDPLAAEFLEQHPRRPCPRSRIRAWPTRGRNAACTGWSAVRRCAFGQVGARICSVTPGIIDTPMGRQEAAARDTNDMLVQMAAIKREGVAEEVAAGAAFLLSDEASFISGIDLPVDGGVVAAIRGGGACHGTST